MEIYEDLKIQKQNMYPYQKIKTLGHIFLIGIHSMQDWNSHYKAWSYKKKESQKD